MVVSADKQLQGLYRLPSIIAPATGSHVAEARFLTRASRVFNYYPKDSLEEGRRGGRRYLGRALGEVPEPTSGLRPGPAARPCSLGHIAGPGGNSAKSAPGLTRIKGPGRKGVRRGLFAILRTTLRRLVCEPPEEAGGHCLHRDGDGQSKPGSLGPASVLGSLSHSPSAARIDPTTRVTRAHPLAP